MDNHNIEKVWPEWHVDKVLGKGSFGEVFSVVRHDSNLTDSAAVKVICIPRDYAEIEAIRADGIDDAGIRAYFKGIVDDFIGEIKVMISLKGISNIVTVEDYKVVQNNDGIGWKIYIRMELLTSFTTHMKENRITQTDVLTMGKDICSALEMCAKCNIIHRDIKPENIFVNRFGIYKLGDFGIARKIDNISMGLSQKGTFNYMAPEVYSGNVYDARVDIYSLGIVMYKLLNNGLFPLLAPENASKHDARQAALDARLKGAALPPPVAASPEVARIILKACAFHPDNRYSSAVEMKTDIIKAMYAAQASSSKPSESKKASATSRSQSEELVGMKENAPKGKKPVFSETDRGNEHTQPINKTAAEPVVSKTPAKPVPNQAGEIPPEAPMFGKFSNNPSAPVSHNPSAYPLHTTPSAENADGTVLVASPSRNPSAPTPGGYTPSRMPPYGNSHSGHSHSGSNATSFRPPAADTFLPSNKMKRSAPPSPHVPPSPHTSSASSPTPSSGSNPSNPARKTKNTFKPPGAL